MFSKHKRIKLEIKNKKISRKSQNIWKLNNTLPNKSSIKIKRKIRNYFDPNENDKIKKSKFSSTKPLTSTEEEFYSTTCIY